MTVDEAAGGGTRTSTMRRLPTAKIEVTVSTDGGPWPRKWKAGGASPSSRTTPGRGERAHVAGARQEGSGGVSVTGSVHDLGSMMSCIAFEGGGLHPTSVT